MTTTTRALLGCGCLALAVGICCPSRTVAADPAPANAAPSAEQIQSWIKQLDDDAFSVRQQATQQLRNAGLAVIAPVQEAAAGNSLEVTTRAIDVLKSLAKSPEAETKKQAEEALSKLKASPNATTARLATQALAPDGPLPTENPPTVLNRVQLGLGNVGPGVRITTKTVNGEKQIEVQEKDRAIKISDSPTKGIEITVTETVDGKPKETKYAAKNAEELQKNHPAGHELYQKYAQRGNAAGAVGRAQIQIQAGNGIPIQIQGVPIQIQAQIVPGNDQAKAAEALKAAQSELKNAVDQLRKSANDSNNAELKKQIEQIEAAMKKLEEAGKKLAGE